MGLRNSKSSVLHLSADDLCALDRARILARDAWMLSGIAAAMDRDAEWAERIELVFELTRERAGAALNALDETLERIARRRRTAQLE
jgi:hypothetical protein